MTTATRPRSVRVEHCMGTVFTVDVRDPGEWDDAIGDVVAWLHEVDAVFSTYRTDSDISRMGRGELTLRAAHPEVTTVLDLSAQVQLETDGAFSAVNNRRLDPTGLVKGWAVERASRMLRERGSRNHAVNGGGDVQLAGEPAPGRPWTVGIADPLHPDHYAVLVSGHDFAVATSGTAERGHHIIDPATGLPAAGFASVTLIGDRIARTDAYATAVFAMGPRRGLEWVEKHEGFEAYAVLPDGKTLETGGFARYLTG